MADYWSKDDNYLDWLKDEARCVREEFDNNLREPEEPDWENSDEDEDEDWTREDERAAERECF